MNPFELSAAPLISIEKEYRKKDSFGLLEDSDTVIQSQITISYMLTSILVILAVSLSWQCHRRSCMSTRILHAITAGIFSFWYLLFYFIYRIFLVNPCPSDKA